MQHQPPTAHRQPPTAPRARAWLVVLAAASLTLLAADIDEVAPNQPPDSIGVRLADVPEDRQDDPFARAAISAVVAPGGRFTRLIDVVSTTDEPTTVEVYGGNGSVAEGLFQPADARSRGLADWISPDVTEVTLPPQSVRRIEIAVDVPSDAPLGEQYGYVWVEPPASEGELAVTNRVGIRVLVTVATGAAPPLDFTVGSMTAARDDGGVPVVTTRLRNTGGRALVIGGELTLRKGPAGLDAGPFAFERSLALAPGDIGTLTVALDPDLPDGPWRARVTAVAGLLERTAEAEIAFPSAAAAQAPSQDTEIVAGTDEEGRDISESLRNQRRMLLPLASLLVLLAIAALWLLHQWRAEGATPGEDPVESEPPRGDEEAVGAER